MDWLSRPRAKIVCYEKIVHILLSNKENLEVYGEHPEGNLKQLKTIKVNKPKLEDIPVVRNFPYYRELKKLAIKNEYPLSRINALFDQLQGSRRFIINFSKIAKPLTLLTQKNQKFEWGDEQENPFQTLKDMLCDAPILALPKGTDDFVVYCDASNQGFGCVLMQRNKVTAYASRQLKIHEKNYTTHDLELGAVATALILWRHYLYETKSVVYTDHKSLPNICDQKELNMRLRCWIDLFSSYDCEICYHPRKVNVVADALSKKEWMKLRRARAMSMTNHSSIKAKILEAQSEASKVINTLTERLRGFKKQLERKEDNGLYFVERIWVSAYGNLRTLIMNEAQTTKYSVHPGADKMYYNLRDLYWWLGIKKDISILQDGKLCKSIHQRDRTRLDMSTAYHQQIDGQSERTMKTLEDMHSACTNDFEGNWDTHLLLVGFPYNNDYHPSINYAPFEALYGRRRSQARRQTAFVEEPMEIIDREVKKLKKRQIHIVQVCWNSWRGPEFTWKREDEMKWTYPQLFVRYDLGRATKF
nr:putative reverse transcriptase domain-containing protein [Tanacetum cinerariifolium]